MPTIRKRQYKRRYPNELSEDQVDSLLSGYSLAPEPFASEEERRVLWMKHRDELLRYVGRTEAPGFYARHGIPLGHRPSAFWQYDVEEPRRRLRGDPTIQPMGTEIGPKGILRYWSAYVDPSEFESEAEYLERHNLLTPQEAKGVRV